jgi:hypothetical protein
VATQGSTWLRHFTDDEYTALVIPADKGRYESSRTRRQGRREFIEQWPDLGAWMTAPVADRLMHAPPYAEARHRHVVVRGHRLYVSLLAMHDRLTLDYPWLFANSFKDLLTESGKLLGMGPEWLTPLDVEAQRIGYRQPAAHRTLAGASMRIALHRGNPDWRTITVEDLDRFRAELDAFAARDDCAPCGRSSWPAGGYESGTATFGPAFTPPRSSCTASAWSPSRSATSPPVDGRTNARPGRQRSRRSSTDTSNAPLRPALTRTSEPGFGSSPPGCRSTIPR